MKNRLSNIKRSTLPKNLVNKDGVKIKVYVQGHMIGAGKMDLLYLISQKGSIQGAAKSMGMSKKKASFLLKTIEDIFSNPVLTKKGGNTGTTLTPFGKELLENFLKLNERLSLEAQDFINWVKIKKSSE